MLAGLRSLCIISKKCKYYKPFAMEIQCSSLCENGIDIKAAGCAINSLYDLSHS